MPINVVVTHTKIAIFVLDPAPDSKFSIQFEEPIWWCRMLLPLDRSHCRFVEVGSQMDEKRRRGASRELLNSNSLSRSVALGGEGKWDGNCEILLSYIMC
jgi:hypothetical protein